MAVIESSTDNELRRLKEELEKAQQKNRDLQAELAFLRSQTKQAPSPQILSAEDSSSPTLSLEEYARYGRQMLVPPIGLPGQISLKASRVLLVGAGGLGCPAAVYLAGAGVGTLGLCDGDEVEVSNLHRQILHSTPKVGMKKVDSVIAYVRELNPHVRYVPHREHLTPESALDIFSQYDLILDCTDHPFVRYLISDTAVLLGKPIVSASALRSEGQLIVLNYPVDKGPCYRCIWPTPPAAETVTSCGEGGIIGPVVGTMGILQALEAIKILAKRNQPGETVAPTSPVMTIFSAVPTLQFRHLKMRSKRTQCVACGTSPTITKETLLSSSEYIQSCGGLPSDPSLHLLSPNERISPSEYKALLDTERSHILIDTRPSIEFGICRLPYENTLNIPMRELDLALKDESTPSWIQEKNSLYFVCKQGNDSQLAVQKVLEARKEKGLSGGTVKDIAGGLRAWSRSVDPDMPVY